MIKTMRDAAHNYPWLLKSIMGILAVAFIITMGWWGFGEQAGGPVAKVGDQSISLDEFKRTYENMHRLYKDNVKTDFKEEEFKDFVVGQLVDPSSDGLILKGIAFSFSTNKPAFLSL